MNKSIRKVSISFLVCLVATIALNVQTSLGKENLPGTPGFSSGGESNNKNAASGDQKFAALENEANNSNSSTSSNEFRNASLLNESTGQARMLGEFKAPTQKKTGHLVPPACVPGAQGCLEQKKQLQLEQTPSSNQSLPSNGTLGPGLLSNLGKLNLTGQAQNENRTGGEEASKPSLSTKHPFNAQILSRILGEFKAPTQKLVPLQPVLPSNYKIKVTFDSVTVHNYHEGLYSGDGEYDLAVYVQGKKLSLTDAGGSGGGLWDVGSGETVTFPAGTERTVEVPSNLPLSILTVGSEVDGCDRTAFPEDVQSEIVRVLTLNGALRNIADDINDGINWIGCKLNPNDVLGVVNKVYPPTTYGEGSHSEKSDAGDFTLRYTIAVTPPTAPPTTTSSPSGQILGNLGQQKQLQLEQTPSSNQSSPSNGTLGPGLLSNLGKLNVTEQAQNENQTGGAEEASKPSLQLLRPLKSLSLADALGQTLAKVPKGKILPPLEGLSNTYKIKVTFDSVMVHDDHEGVFSGDGEYDLAVYVQGKKISLTDAGGSGGGLWDVGSGETVTFPADTAVSVDIPGNLPLSIFTVGSEVDGCDRTAFPDDIKSIIVSIFTHTNPGYWAQGIINIHDYIEARINWVGCKLNPNDSIGTVNKIYPPTDYGEGSHSEKSDAGDFTLRYTIAVTPPPAAPPTTKLPSGQILGNLGQQKQLQLEQTPSSNQSSPSNGTLGSVTK